ncbi:MAG TPA: SWIM zinc finger family protein [Tepidisphaeraceae bacterium]|nr:SWIM zinc finger family protein [Tepidisphaeraceae bacterium]
MATATQRKPKSSKPPDTCRWLVRPMPCRDTEVGILAINGVEYAVTLSEGRKAARLTKAGPERTQYHVDLASSACDCPDRKYRNHPCKHARALAAAVSVLPAVDTPELSEAAYFDGATDL